MAEICDKPVLERAILFSAPMIRAILEDRKTQTRRIIKPQPESGWGFESPPVFGRITSPHRHRNRFGAFIRRGVGTDFPQVDLIPSPYGMPGDRLWVRETFCPVDDREHGGNLWYDYRATPRYEASHPAGWDAEPDHPDALKWKPSIHMPRAASRITLEITGVRVERLNRISEYDAEREGCSPSSEDEFGNVWTQPQYTYGFRKLWESINGAGSWELNPWVWVVEFERVRGGVR